MLFRSGWAGAAGFYWGAGAPRRVGDRGGPANLEGLGPEKGKKGEKKEGGRRKGVRAGGGGPGGAQGSASDGRGGVGTVGRTGNPGPAGLVGRLRCARVGFPF